MRIVGLHGKAGAGKDTFADRLVEKHGYVKVGFSDALYEEVAAAFGVEVTDLLNRERKEQPHRKLTLDNCVNCEFVAVALACGHWDDTGWRSPRQVLQLWGTQYRRAQDQNYWVKRMAQFMNAVYIDSHYKGIAVRDVRFVNEAEMIKKRDGVVIEIVRPGAGTAFDHASEKRLPPGLIDSTVSNCTSLEWLNFCADFLGYMGDENGPAAQR